MGDSLSLECSDAVFVRPLCRMPFIGRVLGG